MTWHDYSLEETVLKATDRTTLWKTEKGLVEIDKDALAVAVMHGDRKKGYIFHGHGKLLLDTIVETEEGAVGKSIERELDAPFLMLGDEEETQKHLSPAGEEDLKKHGHGSSDEFLKKAEDLMERFCRRRGANTGDCCGSRRGAVFAFPNHDDKLDVLVLKDGKLVYKTANMVFVSGEDKAVLKSPEQIVVSNRGRLCIIKQRRLF
jgi:hypothetical protein